MNGYLKRFLKLSAAFGELLELTFCFQDFYDALVSIVVAVQGMRCLRVLNVMLKK